MVAAPGPVGDGELRRLRKRRSQHRREGLGRRHAAIVAFGRESPADAAESAPQAVSATVTVRSSVPRTTESSSVAASDGRESIAA